MELKAEREDPRHISMEAPLFISSYIIKMLLFQLSIALSQSTAKQPLLAHDSAIWARLGRDSLSLFPVVFVGWGNITGTRGSKMTLLTCLVSQLDWFEWLGPGWVSLPLKVSQLLVSLACFTWPLCLQLIISQTSLHAVDFQGQKI